MHKIHTYLVTYSFTIEAHDPDEAADYVVENGDFGDPDDVVLVEENVADCPEDDCPLLEFEEDEED